MRDITLGITFYHQFTTRAFATGVPAQLGDTPALSVLEENNATPITDGVSVNVDRASVTGLNEATIVATGGNGYETGKSYCIYISNGQVGGVSVIGEVVGHFTIEQAPVNWANISNPTTAVDLSGTDIQLVDTVTVATDAEADIAALNDLAATDIISSGQALDTTLGVLDVVNLTNTTTASTNAETAIGNLNDVAATDIVSGGAINTTTGAVDSVTLVATTTVATDAEADIAALNDLAATDILSSGQALDTTLGVLDVVALVDLATTTTTAITATNLTNAPTNGDLTATMKTSVNTEVLDVLNTDTFAEPGQENPTSTASLVYKIGMLYKYLINQVWVTDSQISVYDAAASVVDQKATRSDDATTYKRGDFASGP